MSWFVQICLTSGLALAGLLYGKKLLDMMDLGGVSEGLKGATKFGWGAGKGTTKTSSKGLWRGGRGLRGGVSGYRQRRKTGGGRFSAAWAGALGGAEAAGSALNPLRRRKGAAIGRARGRKGTDKRLGKVGQSPSKRSGPNLAHKDGRLTQGEMSRLASTKESLEALDAWEDQYNKNKGRPGYQTQDRERMIRAAQKGQLRIVTDESTGMSHVRRGRLGDATGRTGGAMDKLRRGAIEGQEFRRKPR